MLQLDQVKYSDKKTKRSGSFGSKYVPQLAVIKNVKIASNWFVPLYLIMKITWYCNRAWASDTQSSNTLVKMITGVSTWRNTNALQIPALRTTKLYENNNKHLR